MSNIKDVPMVMVLLSYFSRNCWAWRMDEHTYSLVTTHIFEIDGLRSCSFATQELRYHLISITSLFEGRHVA